MTMTTTPVVNNKDDPTWSDPPCRQPKWRSVANKQNEAKTDRLLAPSDRRLTFVSVWTVPMSTNTLTTPRMIQKMLMVASKSPSHLGSSLDGSLFLTQRPSVVLRPIWVVRKIVYDFTFAVRSDLSHRGPSLAFCFIIDSLKDLTLMLNHHDGNG